MNDWNKRRVQKCNNNNDNNIERTKRKRFFFDNKNIYSQRQTVGESRGRRKNEFDSSPSRPPPSVPMLLFPRLSPSTPVTRWQTPRIALNITTFSKKKKKHAILCDTYMIAILCLRVSNRTSHYVHASLCRARARTHTRIVCVPIRFA